MRPTLLASLSLLLCVVLPSQRPLRGARPNILFVFSDDHASHAISAYGSQLNKTPNIDRIAQTGLLFRNNFCGNALCGPSRATILTGLHSHQNGFMRNGNVFDGDQTTFPKLLQKAGYQTAIIGKWHLHSDPQGFDHWMVLPGQGQYYNPDFLTKEGRKRYQGHATNLTTKFAIEWLEQRDDDKPFLLMCQHKAPHRNWLPAPEDLGLYRDADLPEPATLFDDYAGRGPMAKAQEMSIADHMFLHYDLLVPPEDWDELKGTDASWRWLRRRMTKEQLETFDAAYEAENAAFLREDPQGEERVRWAYQRYIKNYLRCVNGVDRSVGELLGWLDAHPDVARNTIVIYSSDQGFYLGDHGWYDKRWMYEESLRMPLVVSWPEHIQAGREVEELTQNIDFAPTFLELAGVPVPEHMHGESLVPLLARKPGEQVEWRDAIYYHYYESHAVHMVPAMYGVRTERYKLVRYYEPQWDTWELFDLERDPQELRDVAGDPAYAMIRKQLEQRLNKLRMQYRDDTGDVLTGGFPIQAGLAYVHAEGDGYRIWANTSGSYLLREGERAGTTTLRTTIRPGEGGRLRNGFVMAAGAGPRTELVRAGIDFDEQQLVLVGPKNLEVTAKCAVKAPLDAAVEISVRFDLDKHLVVAEALGERVEAELPLDWQRLQAWGIGASNAVTVFGALSVE